jgi:hypothetical protein
MTIWLADLRHPIKALRAIRAERRLQAKRREDRIETAIRLRHEQENPERRARRTEVIHAIYTAPLIPLTQNQTVVDELLRQHCICPPGKQRILKEALLAALDEAEARGRATYSPEATESAS